ncbi:MAG: phosphoribosylformylglycinamidine synthase, partial [Ramlibacter sp.]|nr:phosphoribosylformylglycinamidine synthase [Ramlibacter sp.]
MTPHITEFEGGCALSDFRIQQILPRLQAIHPQVNALSARFVHLVATDHALGAEERARIGALLTYGDPWGSPPMPGDGALVVVTPRFGTVSPWASKATDIAHNCALAVRRVERITEFRVGAKRALEPAQARAVAALLHDRMTESAMFSRAESHALFNELPAA